MASAKTTKTAEQPKDEPKATGTAVATAKKNEIAGVAIPDFMKGLEGQGTENIGLNDVAVPRIKLMQSNSPELDTFPLTRGQFFHTLLEDSIGMDVNAAVAREAELRQAKLGRNLTVEEIGRIPKNFLHQLRVAVIYSDLRYMLWNPRDSGGGILARADDGVHWNPPNVKFNVTLDKKMGGKQVVWETKNTVAASGLANWGTMDPSDPKSQPAATKMFNLVVGAVDYPDLPPMVVTLQRSAVSIGSKLIGKLKITRVPSYGMIFKMQSVKDSNGSDEFYNYQFIMDDLEPLVQDPDLFENYKSSYEFFKSEGLKVRDIEGLQDEQQPETRGGAGQAQDQRGEGAPSI